MSLVWSEVILTRWPLHSYYAVNTLHLGTHCFCGTLIFGGIIRGFPRMILGGFAWWRRTRLFDAAGLRWGFCVSFSSQGLAWCHNNTFPFNVSRTPTVVFDPNEGKQAGQGYSNFRCTRGCCQSQLADKGEAWTHDINRWTDQASGKPIPLF